MSAHWSYGHPEGRTDSGLASLTQRWFRRDVLYVDSTSVYKMKVFSIKFRQHVVLVATSAVLCHYIHAVWLARSYGSAKAAALPQRQLYILIKRTESKPIGQALTKIAFV